MDEPTKIDPEILEQAEKAQALINAKLYFEQHQREFTDEDHWYPWQHESFEAPERNVMVMAGNRTGKTHSGGNHFAVDVTGDYPEWWRGYQFEFPIHALAMGVDNDQLKAVVQQELIGDVEDRHCSGGWIHKDEVKFIEPSRYDSKLARHIGVYRKGGGLSRVGLRAYTQSKTGHGTLSFAGTAYDRVWIDECPPDSLVGQLRVRTMTGNMGQGGRTTYTLTPELGATQLVVTFQEGAAGHRLVGPIAWRNCPHLTPEICAEMLVGIPEHEREMRSEGTPYFGSGMVYPIPLSRLLIDPFEIPPYYLVGKGMDHGINPDPTAIAWMAFNPETSVRYLVQTYRVPRESVATHSRAMQRTWPEAPVVFPHDVKQGTSRVEHSGQSILDEYEKNGIANAWMFENPDKTHYVEPGVLAMNEWMRDGTFKVFRGQCSEYEREHVMYHRKNGVIVKGNDHVMDATRVIAQMLPDIGIPFKMALQAPRHSKPRVRRASPPIV